MVWTYALLLEELSAIKIGKAKDVQARMKSHRCSCPERLILLAQWRGNFEYEAAARFNELRLRKGGTEWYRLHDELIDWICEMSGSEEPRRYQSFVFPEALLSKPATLRLGRKIGDDCGIFDAFLEFADLHCSWEGHRFEDSDPDDDDLFDDDDCECDHCSISEAGMRLADSELITDFRLNYADSVVTVVLPRISSAERWQRFGLIVDAWALLDYDGLLSLEAFMQSGGHTHREINLLRAFLDRRSLARETERAR